MAQFYTDFSEYTLDEAPHDWTLHWNNPSDFKVVEATGTRSGSALFILNSTFNNSNRGFIWDTVGNVTGDCEVLARLSSARNKDVDGGDRTWGAASGLQIMVDPNVYRRHYNFSWRNNFDGIIRIKKNVDDDDPDNNGYTSLASKEVDAPQWDHDTEWAWFKVRKTGDLIQYKWWRDVEGVGEPYDWVLETTNSAYQSGFIGAHLNTRTSTMLVDTFSVGTDGDPAPTAPFDAGPRVVQTLSESHKVDVGRDVGVSIPLPPASVGELYYLFLRADSGFSFQWDTPVGWHLVSEPFNQIAGFARVADGSEEDSVLVNNPSSINRGYQYIIHTISGFAGNPETDIAWSGFNSNSGSSNQTAEGVVAPWYFGTSLFMGSAAVNDSYYLVDQPYKYKNLIREEHIIGGDLGSTYTAYQTYVSDRIENPGHWTMEGYVGIKNYAIAFKGGDSYTPITELYLTSNSNSLSTVTAAIYQQLNADALAASESLSQSSLNLILQIASQSDGQSLAEAGLDLSVILKLIAQSASQSLSDSNLRLVMSILSQSENQSLSESNLNLLYRLAADSAGQALTQSDLYLLFRLMAESEGRSTHSGSIYLDSVIASDSFSEAFVASTLHLVREMVSNASSASDVTGLLRLISEMSTDSVSKSTASGLIGLVREIIELSAGSDSSSDSEAKIAFIRNLVAHSEAFLDSETLLSLMNYLSAMSTAESDSVTALGVVANLFSNAGSVSSTDSLLVNVYGIEANTITVSELFGLAQLELSLNGDIKAASQLAGILEGIVDRIGYLTIDGLSTQLLLDAGVNLTLLMNANLDLKAAISGDLNVGESLQGDVNTTKALDAETIKTSPKR